jgi:hypothetical protein
LICVRAIDRRDEDSVNSRMPQALIVILVAVAGLGIYAELLTQLLGSLLIMARQGNQFALLAVAKRRQD